MRIVGAFILIALTAGAALAHPGGLDRSGCHHNRKSGDYHCHR
ncbi:YHYH domain-containing protein [Microvirga thermotolerans]|uniref:YHYH domain-containing protein n=1 Tax=Microvirga thermotolerans TaxID=2651334 RepID=A0A5P9JYL7_9HYPH|nr:YHYH domain-containing protein [Microvirga thermotolerans]QFU16736.1 YHYH domain-containing protein [Microvirga thermotolerans]